MKQQSVFRICCLGQEGYIGGMTEQYEICLPDRAILRVGGADAVDFLQGLVSVNMEKIRDKKAVYGAFLTPQGKYLHDFFAVAMQESVYMDCEATRIEDFQKRLKLYKLRSKIDLEIMQDVRAYALIGQDALETLGLPGTLGSTKNMAAGIVYTDPRLTAVGARAIMSADQVSAFSFLGFTAGEVSNYDRLRLSLGLPNGSQDMEVEKATLLESGFEELNGVDFDKGCYLGQELTARTKYRGLVKKRLMPVRIEGDTPAPGTEIMQNGKNAGELRSTAGDIGMALIRLEALESDSALTAGQAKLSPQTPEWADF